MYDREGNANPIGTSTSNTDPCKVKHFPVLQAIV